MLRNYLKITLRTLRKHKGYSLINVGGLSLGMACSLIILLYVQDEWSYDRFHQNADVVHRVNWDYKWNNNEGIGPGTPPPLAAAFTSEIPDITAATRVFPVSRMVVRYEDLFFNEDGLLGVDSNFFALFDFPLLAGDAETALSGPNKVILTEEAARKYFGEEPALGKLLTLGDEQTAFFGTYDNTFEVTGIVQGPPPNSHLQFDMLTSMASHPQVAYFDWSWVWMQVTTYVQVQEGASVPAIEAKIPAIVQRHAPDAFRRVGFSYDELVESGGRWDFVLQPLTDVYLGSTNIGNRLGPLGNRVYVFVFSTVAVFILLIACINFMNLATARSATRAREIGVRKALGAPRRMLVGQFFMESMVMSTLAMPIALLMVDLFIGPFNQLSGKALRLDLFESFWLPAVLAGLTVVVGVVAGSYPGLYLSSFRPVHVLKGKRPSGNGRQRLRNGLVVFQFAMTIGLIACTLLVQQQMAYVRGADLGYDREGIVVLSNENQRLGDQAEAFRDQVKSHARVRHASISTGVPPRDGFEDYYKAEGKGDEQFSLISYMTDEGFAATLGLELIRGRGFSSDRSTDAESVILNEAAVKAFGWQDPIGQTIHYPGQGVYQVIGVMKDFNFMTLHTPITPFALFHSASQSYQIPDSYVVVRLQRSDLEKSLALLQAEWKRFAPDTPFEYTFLDQSFDDQYLAEQRLGRIFLIFSLLTIIIACMGLLGLAAFSAEQRTKEIGIRKVLGASTPNLVALLSREFMKWVLGANLFAWPIAWYVMHRWLQDFAYHIDVGGWVFVAAGGLALLIALLTVSYQAIRAALTNPVNALRYE